MSNPDLSGSEKRHLFAAVARTPGLRIFDFTKEGFEDADEDFSIESDPPSGDQQERYGCYYATAASRARQNDPPSEVPFTLDSAWLWEGVDPDIMLPKHRVMYKAIRASEEPLRELLTKDYTLGNLILRLPEISERLRAINALVEKFEQETKDMGMYRNLNLGDD